MTTKENAMLTDERIDEIKEKHTYSTKDFDAHRFAMEIEAEVLQAQEPAALDKLLNDFAITCAFGSADERVSAATAIRSLFAAPQPTAPCPKCAQYEIDFALEHDDKVALEAKVIEQSAEIERLNSAYEAIDEQRNRDFETIAQQAERIAELEEENIQRLETSCQQHAKIMAQAALIEKCEHLIRRYMTETPLGNQPHMIAHIAEEALAAIAAHKS